MRVTSHSRSHTPVIYTTYQVCLRRVAETGAVQPQYTQPNKDRGQERYVLRTSRAKNGESPPPEIGARVVDNRIDGVRFVARTQKLRGMLRLRHENLLGPQWKDPWRPLRCCTDKSRPGEEEGRVQVPPQRQPPSLQPMAVPSLQSERIPANEKRSPLPLPLPAGSRVSQTPQPTNP